MKTNTLKNYLQDKYNQLEDEFVVDDCIETIIPIDSKDYNRIAFIYKDNWLSMSVFYGKFLPKHMKAVHAFIDNYNEQKGQKYELLSIDNQIWIEIVKYDVDEKQAVDCIEDVLADFIQLNDLTIAIHKLGNSAQYRAETIAKRVDSMKKQALEFESRGDHKSAMNIFKEICTSYYGKSHMEIIGLFYKGGAKTKYGEFPDNMEYKYECDMYALDDEANILVPYVAYNMAKKLNKTSHLRYIIAQGQQRGTWDAIALHHPNSINYLNWIADCYRQGFGCEASEICASYYDRLSAGERSSVFKDMLMNGHDRVFKLMWEKDYYEIRSLSDLDGMSEEFKDRFLYGDPDAWFELPNWFVPMVNSLPKKDREIVLEGAFAKLKSKISSFYQKLFNEEYELIKVHSDRLIKYEDDGKVKTTHITDLSQITTCEVLERIQDEISKLYSTLYMICDCKMHEKRKEYIDRFCNIPKDGQ